MSDARLTIHQPLLVPDDEPELEGLGESWDADSGQVRALPLANRDEVFELLCKAYEPTEEGQRASRQLDIVMDVDATLVVTGLLQHATYLMLEGRHYLKFRNHPVSQTRVAAFRWLYQSVWNFLPWLEVLAASIPLLLTLFEFPAVFKVGRQVRILLAFVELFCLLAFVGIYYLRSQVVGGWSAWLQRLGNRVRVAIWLLLLIDVIVAVADPAYDASRILRLLRPFFLVDTFLCSGARRVVQQTLFTSVRAIDMVLLFITYVLLWSIVAHAFFGPESVYATHLKNRTAAANLPDVAGVDTHFITFNQSVVSMFVAITTANYPDVGMQTMFSWQPNALFFVIYMFLGVYFVLNFFLAVVYENFLNFENTKQCSMILHQRRALRRAYCLAVRASVLERRLTGGADADRFSLQPDSLMEDAHDAAAESGATAKDNGSDATPPPSHGHDGSAESDEHEHLKHGSQLVVRALQDPDKPLLTRDIFDRLVLGIEPRLGAKQRLLVFAYLTRLQHRTDQLTHNEQSRANTSRRQPKRCISLNEFYGLFDALENDWALDRRATLRQVTTSPDPFAYGTKEPWHTIKRACAFADTTWFHHAVTTVILLNLAFVVANASKGRDTRFLDDGTYGECHTHVWEYAFFAFYVIEVFAKLGVYGRVIYFKGKWNRFDFFVVALSAFGFVLEALLSADSGSCGHGKDGGSLVRVVAVVFRCLRMTRVVRIRKSFRHVLLTITFVIRKMFRYILVLLLVMYSFAVIGMVWFHHTVAEDCSWSDPTAWEPCGFAFDPSQATYYQLQNFDNVLLTFNTLFTLLIVNNWQLVMEGHVAVAPGKTAARIFFFVFYLFVVLIVLNIIIAYLLDGFLKLHGLLEKHAENDLSEEQRERSRLAQESALQRKETARHAEQEAGLEGQVIRLGSHLQVGATVTLALSQHALAEQNAAQLYDSFMLSVAQSAFPILQQSALSLRLLTQGQTVVICSVPTPAALSVMSAAEPLVEFKRRVLPLLTEMYEGHQREQRGAEEAAAVSLDTTSAVSLTGARPGREARFTVALDDAHRCFPSGDADLQVVALLSQYASRRALDSVGLQYEAKREITRDSISRALQGEELEWACIQDDNRARIRVERDPLHFFRFDTLAADDPAHGELDEG